MAVTAAKPSGGSGATLRRAGAGGTGSPGAPQGAAPWIAAAIRALAFSAGEVAGQLRDGGDGGEAARRVRATSPAHINRHDRTRMTRFTLPARGLACAPSRLDVGLGNYGGLIGGSLGSNAATSIVR